MKKEKALTKSPIEDKPLRYPAQSLDEKLDNLISQKLLIVIIIPAMFIMLAFNAWISYFGKNIPNPVLFTIMAILSLIWSAYQIINDMNIIIFLTRHTCRTSNLR